MSHPILFPADTADSRCCFLRYQRETLFRKVIRTDTKKKSPEKIRGLSLMKEILSYRITATLPMK